MFKLTILEAIFRGIPEAFVLILAMLALSNIKVNVKKYILSSLLLVCCECGIRMLPVSYGVPTILDIFVMMIIMYRINKIDIVLSIKVSLITTIVLFIYEGANMLLLNAIFKNKLQVIVSTITLKILYGFPSLICFSVITIIYYLRKGNV